MAQEQVTITLPISGHALGTTLFVLGVIVLSVLVFLATCKKEGKDWISQLQEKTGLSGLHPVLIVFVTLVWSTLFLAFLAGIFWVLYGALERSVAVTSEEGKILRWYLLTLAATTAALGAVISFPFTLIRMQFNRRQTETAEQGHITDQINKAVQGLGADKTVKRQRLGADGNPAFVLIDDKPDVSQPITEDVTKPNFEVRIGAIYGLERIAQDSERDFERVMETLCAYVRHNSPAVSAVKSPHEVFRELTTNQDGILGLNSHDAFEHREYRRANTIGVNPTELNPDTLSNWSLTIPQPRPDIQTAITVLGGLKSNVDKEHRHFPLNLSETNLQKCRLQGDFSKSNFEGARLDNCVFDGCFNGASFSMSSLQKLHARAVDFSSCDFGWANLSSAFIGNSNCVKSKFWFALIDHTNFNGAVVRGCDFYESISTHVYFNSGADASYSRFSNTAVNAFKGLDEGPSKGLWGDSDTKVSGIDTDRFEGTINRQKSELDDRREWLCYLKEFDLSAPTKTNKTE